jgi:NRPS condensation-like uncharacterized protein
VTDQQLEHLKRVVRERSEQRRATPGASKNFMIRAGILTKKGKLRASYGGSQEKKKA